MCNMPSQSSLLRQVIIYVRGRVQGVGFRFSTYQKAQQLAIVGYVKNLMSGEVEIVACGTINQIDALIQWLDAGGPVSAKITDYQLIEMKTLDNYTSFNVRY